MVVQSHFEALEPKKLRPMLGNASVFGRTEDELDSKFMNSVRKNGVRAPIICTSKMQICDGHRRTAAAIKVGLDTVPCWISSAATPDEAMDQWADLQENSRVITAEQKSRLNDAVLERKTAKSQEVETASETVAGIAAKILAVIPDSIKDGVSEPSKPDSKKKKPPGEKQTAGRKSKPKTDRQLADEAAKESGLGTGENARKAKKVVTAIDKAEASGDTATAAELRDTLNNQSVNAAVKKLAEKQAADAELDDDSDIVRTFTKADAKTFRDAFTKLIRLVDKGMELEQLTSHDHRDMIRTLQTFGTRWAKLFPAQEWF